MPVWAWIADRRSSSAARPRPLTRPRVCTGGGAQSGPRINPPRTDGSSAAVVAGVALCWRRSADSSTGPAWGAPSSASTPVGPTGAALAGLERGWLCTGGAGLRSPRCWPLLRRAGATSFRAPPRTGGALLLAGATCRSRCAKSPPPVTGRAAAGRTTTRLSPGSTASVSHPDAQASERSHTPHTPPHPTPLPNKNPNAHARRSNAAAQRWAPSAWGRSGRGRTQRRAVSSSAWRSCG